MSFAGLGSPESVRELQQEHFSSLVDSDRFFWLTTHPYISSRERDLFNGIAVDQSCSLLEIGCGEAANLSNLTHLCRNPSHYVGLDFSFKKLAFISGGHQDTVASFICADALFLPFSNDTFETVLIRDVLHHVDYGRLRLLREAYRVLKPGGQLYLLEGNGRGPLNLAFAMIFSHERGMLHSTPLSIDRLFCSVFGEKQFSIEMKEPSNIFRLVAHYRFGFPKRFCEGKCARLLAKTEKKIAELIPPSLWAYIFVEARK